MRRVFYLLYSQVSNAFEASCSFAPSNSSALLMYGIQVYHQAGSTNYEEIIFENKKNEKIVCRTFYQ
jgi:hypothetical protein